jgi:hypothetical protein
MPSRTLQTPAGEIFETDRLLDYGEHAEIWRLKGRADVVAKVWFADATAFAPKLRAMLAAPPAPFDSLAWPTALLYENGRFVGYLMPRVEGAGAVCYRLEAMRARVRDFPNETTRDALQHGAELARTVAQVHQAGHTMGNFSPDTLLWRADGGLAIVGAETFCIRSPDGSVYPPRVPPLEFVAPELRGVRGEKLAWSAAQDAYALARHLQHLLRVFEPNLPRSIRRGFKRAEIPAERPSAAEWGALLEAASTDLVECAGCGNVYSHERRRCPRCSAPRASHSRFRQLGITLGALGLLVATAITFIPWLHRHMPTLQRTGPASARKQEATLPVWLEPEHRYSISLQFDSSQPRRQILQRGDDHIILEARGGLLVATWPSGNAVLAAGDADAFEQKPNPAAWVEGWRDIRLTFAPEREWDAIYRVPWSALGLTVREGAGFPRLVLAGVADESPATEGQLAPGERIAAPELRTVPEPTEAQFVTGLEKLAGSAMTLRVYSGEPVRIESYIASGEFRPKIVAGEYLRVEAIGNGSRAQLAGLRAGDVVTAISGQSTRLLAGPAIEKLLNRNVTLDVYRAGQVRTVVLARDKRLRVSFSPPVKK